MEAGNLLYFFTYFSLLLMNSVKVKILHATEFQEFPSLPYGTGNQRLSRPSRGMAVVEIISRHKLTHFSVSCQTELI
jgi:hypothetical protein